MKRHFYLLTIFLFLSTANIFGLTFGGSGPDHGYKVIRTMDQGYALLGEYEGSAADLYVIKLDSHGNFEWSKIYNNNYGTLLSEYAGDIAQTNDGGYLVIGAQNDPGSNNSLRAWLLRLNASGDTIWTRTYSENIQFEDFASFVEATNSNQFTIGVNSVGLTGIDFLFLVRTDSLGVITDTLSRSPVYGKVLSLSNGYLMTANQSIFNPNYINLYRVDNTGTLLFNKNYSDLNGVKELWGNSSAACGNGSLTVGSTNLYTPHDSIYEFYLLRTDSNGDSLWSKHWHPGKNELTCIVRDNISNYFVAGKIDSSGHRIDFIWKTDSLGDTLWTKFVGNNIWVYSILSTDSGGFALIGDSLNTSSGLTDVWISFYDSLGNNVANPSTDINKNIPSGYNGINVFPNPTKDNITIDCNNYFGTGKYEVRIENALGKILRKENIRQRYYSVDLNAWSGNEFYLVRIIDAAGKTVAVKKVLKY